MINEFIREIVSIDSPSGYTEKAIAHLQKRFSDGGYSVSLTNKKALFVSNGKPVSSAVSVHVDTLGGIVRKVKPDGSLLITQVGGFPNNSFEGEYVRVATRSGNVVTGTYLINNPSTHVNREVSKTERTTDNMHVRLDAEVKTPKETENLGIEIGDYVFFDPRFQFTDTGFVKSRFLDDKACVGVLMDILLNNQDIVNQHNVGFFFSNYEEVGHGAAFGIPSGVKELLVADMGVVGDGVEGDEYSVSICPKDSTGPYDYELTGELIGLAKNKHISYKVDVFPYYGSDGSAALSAGCDLRVALIGPGVSASHGVERTHIKGLKATKELVLEFIMKR
ncbi:MAG: M42 family metallopeptidase [bacterium]|nr:M42 family metallopeptidase [bacterium]